jgi:hypothetical protein
VAREEEQRTAADRQREAQVAAANEKLVSDLRRRYLASDPTATEEEFQRDLPELRRKHREAAVLGVNDGRAEAARRESAQRYRGLF